MRRWGGVICAFLTLSGCGLVTNYSPFRYRVTVEVETPAGLRTGSSVIEARAGEVGTTLGGAGIELRGEAVAVDLPGNRTMFALLRDEAGAEWAKIIMFDVTPQPEVKPGEGDVGFGRHVKAIQKDRALHVVPRMKPGAHGVGPPVSAYPTLVRFRDIGDPRTVERVDPDDLAAVFGVGFKLRRITVQVTEDEVTIGVRKRLWWLTDFQERRLVPLPDGGTTTPSFGQRIEFGDFSKGLGQ